MSIGTVLMVASVLVRAAETNPLVEITVMRQASRQRLLVHFVTLSGHADTAYFAPITMRDISGIGAGKYHAMTGSETWPGGSGET